MEKIGFSSSSVNVLICITMVVIFSACGSNGIITDPASIDERSPDTDADTLPQNEDSSQTGADTAQFEGVVPAPSFPPDMEWLNVEVPLTLNELEGKAVLLDFWTYGCINCIHMLPVLERLEEKYANELVIISVHSAKFDTEGETQNIQQAVQRYGITHPVIIDDEFTIWQQYGAQAWPTFILIDPNGNVLARDAGEIPFDAFDELVGGMIDHFDTKGEINREPLPIQPEGTGEPSTLLRFPGKVLADAEGGRLFIADTNHHRIVVVDLDSYEVLDVIGSGQQGLNDGRFEEASFNQPQGLALYEDNTLFVSDTSNHALRLIDLDARIVTTVAGTGQRGSGFDAPPFNEVVTNPTAVALRSPWDVVTRGKTVYIAMAGMHQIWSYQVEDETLSVVVGNGGEALHNASLADSELAQPSGLYITTDELLYFADSESSSIRVADFAENEVRTAAGPTSNDLFKFGDVDGEVGTSRLQHPLGITGTEDRMLYVADTYNNKIKRLDPETTAIRTVFGLDGDGGFQDGGADVATFDEPGGISYAADRLYIADTNNHAIRVIDLAEGQVSTIRFPNPEALIIQDAETIVAGGNATQNVD